MTRQEIRDRIIKESIREKKRINFSRATFYLSLLAAMPQMTDDELLEILNMKEN